LVVVEQVLQAALLVQMVQVLSLVQSHQLVAVEAVAVMLFKHKQTVKMAVLVVVALI
jgi:hypothetical protein